MYIVLVITQLFLKNKIKVLNKLSWAFLLFSFVLYIALLGKIIHTNIVFNLYRTCIDQSATR